MTGCSARWLSTMARAVMGLILAAGSATAIARADDGIAYDEESRSWLLRSGPVRYRLSLGAGEGYGSGGPVLEGFGPTDGNYSLPAGPALIGTVDGKPLTTADLELVDHAIAPIVKGENNADGDGSQELVLTFRHRAVPLEVVVRYGAWGDTGTFTRRLTATNTGDEPVRVEALPSLVWRLPAGDYELSRLRGRWGQERQLTTEPLELGPEGTTLLGTREGRSTNGLAAWFALREKSSGVLRLGQLAYSGNWELSLRTAADGDGDGDEKALEVAMGLRFDGGGPLVLPPGESIALPAAAFTATSGDLDDAANQLHRYQRRFVIPRAPGDGLLPVQFNTWYPYSDRLDPATLKRTVDAAADLGCEVFVLDAGWFVRRDWQRDLGDWDPSPEVFPDALEAFAQYVRDRGMGLGLWLEIECVSEESRTFTEHPEWCLQAGGQPIARGPRRHLNFALPEVRAHTRSAVDRLMRAGQLAWVKIDYNIDIGDEFDPADPDSGRSGDALRQHLEHYGQWLDELRAAYPALVVESCSSGGLRFDLNLIGHTHTTWISDEVRPRPSLQLAYGSTVEFPPVATNHWMVGDSTDGRVDPDGPPGWWDFQLHVPMNGTFGLSSRVLDWPPALTERARSAVAMYKETIRPVQASADVYHLTPPPDADDPRDWMALEYAAPDRQRAVVLAYRLAGGDPERLFPLRGLDPERSYRVRWASASSPAPPPQVLSGRELAEQGLPIALDAEWRSAVIALEAVE